MGIDLHGSACNNVVFHDGLQECPVADAAALAEEGPDREACVRHMLSYHRRSKHHLHRYAESPEQLDWANQPDPFLARSNEGTHDLQAAWMPERLDDEARQKLAESLHSPERGAKIAAAQRGKKRPPAVIEKMRRARKGVRHSAAARAKMRASHLKRYKKLGRWKPEEDALLGTMPDPALAELLGRHRVTIYERRVKLGVAAFSRG
jgi:hypothetical protein